MSVADQLGLCDETSGLLAMADQRWGHWATIHPALTHCCGVRELRSWLPGADKTDADEALHALATLAAADGGDDIAAAFDNSKHDGLVAARVRRVIDAADKGFVRFDHWTMEDVPEAINVTNYYLMEGEKRRDAPGIDDQRVIAKRAGGFDRDDPSGVHAQIYGLHDVSVTRNRRNVAEPSRSSQRGTARQKKAPRERGAFCQRVAGISA